MMKRAIREIQPDVIQFHWANPFPAAVLLAMIPKSVKLVVVEKYNYEKSADIILETIEREKKL